MCTAGHQTMFTNNKRHSSPARVHQSMSAQTPTTVYTEVHQTFAHIQGTLTRTHSRHAQQGHGAIHKANYLQFLAPPWPPGLSAKPSIPFHDLHVNCITAQRHSWLFLALIMFKLFQNPAYYLLSYWICDAQQKTYRHWNVETLTWPWPI